MRPAVGGGGWHIELIDVFQGARGDRERLLSGVRAARGAGSQGHRQGDGDGAQCDDVCGVPLAGGMKVSALRGCLPIISLP